MRKTQHWVAGLAVALIAAAAPAAAATDLVYFGSHGARLAGRAGAGGQPPRMDPHTPSNGIYPARFNENPGHLTSLGQVTKLFTLLMRIIISAGQLAG